MPSPRIVAVINQKGGVGKTTTTLGLAAAVANAGKQVLVLDMDPQTNASQTLLPDYAERLEAGMLTMQDVLQPKDEVEPEDLPEAILDTAWPGVRVIPSEQRLAQRDAEGAIGIEVRLRRMLRGVPADIDLVLIDCPPAVGRLTVNALAAADEVLLVTEASQFGMQALSQIDETIDVVNETYGGNLTILGLVLNKYENTREASARAAQIAASRHVLMMMPKRAALPEAMGRHQSIFRSKHRDAATVAHWFSQLAVRVGMVEAAAVPERIEMPADSEPVGVQLAAVGA